uniref:Uncharacterized protein n=1 Tax=Pipistrellus kuhlii TaxID=59472 RepID=A0A7J7YMH6_PIPKU|nr:hypothetical protein mPipKuh1_010158 [Pipistrellus kuhlii]
MRRIPVREPAREGAGALGTCSACGWPGTGGRAVPVRAGHAPWWSSPWAEGVPPLCGTKQEVEFYSTSCCFQGLRGRPPLPVRVHLLLPGVGEGGGRRGAAPAGPRGRGATGPEGNRHYAEPLGPRESRGVSPWKLLRSLFIQGIFLLESLGCLFCVETRSFLNIEKERTAPAFLPSWRHWLPWKNCQDLTGFQQPPCSARLSAGQACGSRLRV